MIETYQLNPNLTKTAAVAEWIQQRIDWQIYQPNQRVPSVRKLAKLLHISSFTVVQAYEQLVATSVLIAKPSSGYYVNVMARVHETNKKEGVAKQPVIDTRWLLNQMFSDIPRHRSPGVGVLPNEWIKNDKMEWAIRQVTQQVDDFVYDGGDIQGYLPLRQQLVQYLHTLGMQTHTEACKPILTMSLPQRVYRKRSRWSPNYLRKPAILSWLTDRAGIG